MYLNDFLFLKILNYLSFLIFKEFITNTLSPNKMRNIAPPCDPVDVEALKPTSANANKSKDASEISQKRKDSESFDEDKENQWNGNKKKSNKKGNKFLHKVFKL
jgi:hypothetical protein